MSNFAERLKAKGADKIGKKRKEPLWKGPHIDGITFSLLSRFLACRERFRVYTIEGLSARGGWNHRLGYGTMWHICEEAFAEKGCCWEDKLRDHCKAECQCYPTDQQTINHWYNICKVQFPHYATYWAKHKDIKNRRPLLQEQRFSVPYRLPSGRVVRLRGKWDSVDIVKRGTKSFMTLQENKTKGDIDEIHIERQLSFDLQTGIYLTSLLLVQQYANSPHGAPACTFDIEPEGESVCNIPGFFDTPIQEIRYNVIRRPLSGGRHSIKQKGSETEAEFYQRLGECIAGEPEYFFMRWNVTLTTADITKFRQQCLDPILEQLCDWWYAILDCDGDNPFQPLTPLSYVHWRHPYGLFNSVDERGWSDVDDYLNTGSEVGLTRETVLFQELQ